MQGKYILPFVAYGKRLFKHTPKAGNEIFLAGHATLQSVLFIDGRIYNFLRCFRCLYSSAVFKIMECAQCKQFYSRGFRKITCNLYLSVEYY